MNLQMNMLQCKLDNIYEFLYIPLNVSTMGTSKQFSTPSLSPGHWVQPLHNQPWITRTWYRTPVVKSMIQLAIHY